MYPLMILLVILLIPIPVMMKYMLGKKSAYRGLFEGIVSAVIGVILVFMYFQITTGVTLFNRIDSILDMIKIEEMYTPGMYEMFGFNELDPSELETVMNAMKEIMTVSIPSTIIIWSTILAYFNYKIVSWILRKSGKVVSVLPPLKEFSLPKSVMLGSVLIYFLSYLAANMGIIDKSLIMYNIQTLFSFVFSIQGVAVAFYLGSMRRVPKAVVVIIVVLLISTEIGKTVLFFTGLTDVAFDIRKRFLVKQG